MKTALIALMLCMFSVATVMANETTTTAPAAKSEVKGHKLAKKKKKDHKKDAAAPAPVEPAKDPVTESPKPQ